MKEPSGTSSANSDAMMAAPEYIVDILSQVMRPPHGPPMSAFPALEAARAEARFYANRIWAEAFTAGATFGLARNTQPIRIVVTSETYSQIRSHGDGDFIDPGNP